MKLPLQVQAAPWGPGGPCWALEVRGQVESASVQAQARAAHGGQGPAAPTTVPKRAVQVLVKQVWTLCHT